MRSIFLSLRCIVACSILSLLFSCEHRHLEDPVNTHYVRVYLDEQIKNVTCGFYNDTLEKPEYSFPVNLRIALADPNSGKVVCEKILRGSGKDEKGKYIDGHIAAEAGVYNIVVHEVGTTVTRLNNTNDYNNIFADTDYADDFSLQLIPVLSDSIPRHMIAKQPEHMFYTYCNNVTVKNSRQIDTLWNNNDEHFKAESIALSYYFQIRIKGLQWLSSAGALIGGMAGSSAMNGYRAIVESDSVNIHFSLNYTNKKRSQDSDMTTTVLYATFNTFGRIPSQNTKLSLEFVKQDGSSQIEIMDITSEFEKELVKNNQWILLEREVTITKPEGTGGMQPGVDKWKDIEADVVM